MAFSLKNLAIIVLELNCFRYLSLSPRLFEIAIVWAISIISFLTLKPDSKQFCEKKISYCSGWLQQKEKRKIRIFRDFYAYNMTLPRIKVKGFCYKKVLLRRPLKATWNVLLLLLFWPFLQLNPRKNKIYSLEAGNAINCTVQ